MVLNFTYASESNYTATLSRFMFNIRIIFCVLLTDISKVQSIQRRRIW